jgi:hypothetical protein
MELWSRLEKWQNSSENGVTREGYFTMCEQLEKEPVPDEIPPDIEDFPEDVQAAILTFGKLGDRIVADIGYLGKDWTSLPIHMEILQLDDKDVFIETLLRLDEKIIKKSAEEMRRARKKLEKPSG